MPERPTDALPLRTEVRGFRCEDFMKIRTGFVSNSSSTAFLLLGVKLTPEQFKQSRKQFQQDCDKYDRLLTKLGVSYLPEEKLLGVSLDIDENNDVRKLPPSFLSETTAAVKIQKAANILKIVVAQQLAIYYGMRAT